MLSKLTLIGMSNYSDGAMWDDLVLPEGYDKEIVVSEILRQGGEFSALYPDLDYMKYMIGIWSRKFFHNFERWIKAYNFDYEALYNVDVKTTTTDQAKDIDDELKNLYIKRAGLSNGIENGKNSASNSRAKAAYDANNFKNVESLSDSSSTSLSSSEGHSDSESSSESNSHSWEHSQTITEIKQGNQGLTMSQEMLIAEYNAWRINIYEMVAEIFVSEFCICIYN